MTDDDTTTTTTTTTTTPIETDGPPTETKTTITNQPTDANSSITWDLEDGDDLPIGYSLDMAKMAGLQNGRYPETEEELRKIDEVLSDELAKLSMNEHEEAMFDVVGFRHVEEESDAFLNTKLAELDQELHKIAGNRKKAYDAACKLNPDYAQGRKFRLAFLRSKQFDVKKAASAIVSHFHLKQKFFPNYPPSFLAREMKFTDLSPDAREFVEAGYGQLSPSRDAAGRFVFFYASGLKKYKTVESVYQAFWYLMTCKSRNEELQRRGQVAVVYTLGRMERWEVAIGVHSMIKFGAALHSSALHLCDATWGMRFFVAAQKLLMDNFTRFRLQEHSGTREDINFALQTYGINTDDSPMKSDNTLDTTFHKKWLEAQKLYEENTSKDSILFLHRFDVLFGRNKRCTHHPGTMRCQLLVEMHWKEYEGQNKFERGRIADKIVRIVHESHGRFLKWDGDSAMATGSWKEVDNNTAHAKVTHFFRSLRERKQRSEKPANTSAPKRGIDIDKGTETDTSGSTASLSTKEVSDASLFSKRMRAAGIDNDAESLET